MLNYNWETASINQTTELLSRSYEDLYPSSHQLLIVKISTIVLGALCFYTWITWRSWCKDLRDDRYERWQEKCPSNSQKPLERSENETTNLILSAVAKRRPSIVDDINAAPKFPRESAELSKRSHASPVIRPSGPSGPKNLSKETHRNSTQDMDHVRIKFIDYLWASVFVGPNAVFLWVTGILWLIVRQILHKRGWISPKPCDPRRVVGQLVLESMEAMHFTCERKEGEDKIATFCWTNFPLLNADGTVTYADLFTVDINLSTKLMTKAKLDERTLTAWETITLIYFNSVFVSHPKIHAYANWGVNDNIPNSFVRRMSVTTVLYNYYGYTVFKQLAALWYSLGLCKQNYYNIEEVINHGMKEGVFRHSNLRKFVKHSTLVSFVMKVRNGFMNAFRKYREELHGIDGEALFIGTIIHSLDHSFLEWNLEDPLWLDSDSKDFGAMAELCRFARVGFVPDLPALLFRTRYKDSPHPFYQEVYHHAARIDKTLADHMDACIVK